MRLPHQRLTYGNNNQYKRTWRIALWCWFMWDVKPLFTGEIYVNDNEGKLKRYTNRLYYWLRLFK